MDIKDILAKLNEEQIKPVMDTEGAVLVIAGAGSGKTRVLVSRILYLIMEKNIAPKNIMAITFTNKAAEEMKERLKSYCGDLGDMWVSTIHSMCVKILRRDIDKLGYDRNFNIYDEQDRDRAIKRAFEELDLDQEKLFKIARNMISDAKNECLNPEEFRKAQNSLHFIDDIYNVYVRYNAILERSNALDFDDLLYKTYQLFCEFPEIADYYANKFQYIHIDEFQDTNKVQFAIAQRLSVTHGNIFVVGDDDQSIYGWRGAKIENILNFDDIYRGAKVYKLERNYRSTKKILSLANCIIKNNTGRREKELWTDNDEGVKIETFVGGDENSEASYIATSIKNLIAFSGYSYKDFAVFMRVNAISRAIEQEFTKYAIPYKIYGGFKFFERKEIKDVLSYLKIVNNTLDDEAFLRCISSPRRGIGEKTLQELKEYATLRSLSIYDAIDWIDSTSISSGAKTKLHNFKSLLESFIAFSKTSSVPDLLEHIIEKTSFLEQFSEKSEENESKIMNVNELKNSCLEFSKVNIGSGLADYLNSVTLSSDTDAINDGDAVTVATIHSAKGLEYPVVFIMGCEEKILPIQRSYGDEDEMEEERRLMYVAITRAMQRLYITRAISRYMYGGRENMLPSRFIKEGQTILNPNAMLKQENNTYQERRIYNNYSDFSEERDISNPTGYSSSYAKTMLNDNKPKEQANNCIFKANMKVKHAKFGEGMVILVKGSGDSTVVDVAFKSVGIKSLAVKYAPLEIIK